VFGRVEEQTLTFLQQLGEPNNGRAIDKLVRMAMVSIHVPTVGSAPVFANRDDMPRPDQEANAQR